MPDTRPDLASTAAVAVTACPLLAAHLTALHPGLRTALLTSPASAPCATATACSCSATTTRPRPRPARARSPRPSTWAPTSTMRRCGPGRSSFGPARSSSCPTRTRSWSPYSSSTRARRHDHRRTSPAHPPHRPAPPQRDRHGEEDAAPFSSLERGRRPRPRPRRTEPFCGGRRGGYAAAGRPAPLRTARPAPGRPRASRLDDRVRMRVRKPRRYMTSAVVHLRLVQVRAILGGPVRET
jgi:hypothetical protein